MTAAGTGIGEMGSLLLTGSKIISSEWHLIVYQGPQKRRKRFVLSMEKSRQGGKAEHWWPSWELIPAPSLPTPLLRSTDWDPLTPTVPPAALGNSYLMVREKYSSPDD